MKVYLYKGVVLLLALVLLFCAVHWWGIGSDIWRPALVGIIAGTLWEIATDIRQLIRTRVGRNANDAQ